MDPCDDPGVCSGSPPALARRGPRRRAWLVGSAYEVWEVVAVLERRGSPDAVAAETGLSEDQVRIALEFWERYPDEIEAALAEERAPVRGAGGAGPGPGALEAPELATVDGAVPVRRWLERQLRQPVEFRERLEAAAQSNDPAEVRRLLERVPFSDAQRRHVAELLAEWEGGAPTRATRAAAPSE
jgi:uncharacterized protein (DUF433 family)